MPGRIGTMATQIAAGMSAVLFAALPMSAATAADRLRDKDVAALIERIDHERDRFEDQLDGKLKRSILRRPDGEVDVERYLDDLQENVDKLKDRFTTQYAASAEVTTVLRQGADIQRFMSTQPPGLDGASEWNRLATSLGQLAAAYSTAFPVPDGTSARRMNDGEARKAANDVAKSADRFKKELDSALKSNKAISEATRDAAVSEADALKHEAQKLASTIGDDKPASGEAQAVLARAAAIRSAWPGQRLSPAAKTAWGVVESGIDLVAQAFALPARRP